VTSIGLVVFQANVKVNTFSWSKIVKISFKRKQFFIQLRKESSENYDTLLGKWKFVPGNFVPVIC
jgi:tyrosine-protein phosphatase non-receptor type 4